MHPQPTLFTERLQLRPFVPADVSWLVPLLGVREVAMQTLTVPHPYRAEDAEQFIARQAERWEAGKGVTWAIILRDGDEPVGAVGLELVRAHRRAELGYWVSQPRWGQGIATEAARAAIEHGFTALGCHRIEASHYPENPVSGAVMRKLGMQYEGRARAMVWRDGVPRDNERYAILATDPRP